MDEVHRDQEEDAGQHVGKYRALFGRQIHRQRYRHDGRLGVDRLVELLDLDADTSRPKVFVLLKPYLDLVDALGPAVVVDVVGHEPARVHAVEAEDDDPARLAVPAPMVGVGVMAASHKVITNLLVAVSKESAKHGANVRALPDGPPATSTTSQPTCAAWWR